MIHDDDVYSDLEVPEDYGFPCEWCGSSQRMMQSKGFQRLKGKRANHWRCLFTRRIGRWIR